MTENCPTEWWPVAIDGLWLFPFSQAAQLRDNFLQFVLTAASGAAGIHFVSSVTTITSHMIV
jgi:hypothetical protein